MFSKMTGPGRAQVRRVDRGWRRPERARDAFAPVIAMNTLQRGERGHRPGCRLPDDAGQLARIRPLHIGDELGGGPSWPARHY